MAPQDLASIFGLRSEKDLGAGISNKAKQTEPPRDLKPQHSQASRALGLAGYFVSGCMAINASQVLGAPLYLINKEWYNSWIAFTMQSWGLLTMTMTQWWAPTVVRVSGDSTMRGQLIQTTDGQFVCNFPERLVLIANHQIYTDWLYLWWIGYTAGMHGRIYVVLKESLKNIPVIGWGMQFAQFIFLKRKWESDKPRLAQHMQRFKNQNPMWLMLFPEGTNLADSTRENSRKWAAKNGIKDMQHMLLPRSTGLHFMLNELKDHVEYVYDCTIAYEGVPRGQYAQDIFTVGASYLGGRPPKSVNMYWRRFRVANIPLNDPQKFDLWLRARWAEKDRFIENWYRTGRFPADTGYRKDYNGRVTAGAGYIDAEVKPQRWYEFLQVFAPIGLFALVLYAFYGSLPQEMINSIKSIDQATVVKQLDAIQKGQLKVPETKDIIATAPKHLQNRFDAVRKLAEAKHTTPEKIIAQIQSRGSAGTVEKAATNDETKNGETKRREINNGETKKLEAHEMTAKQTSSLSLAKPKSKPSKLPGNPNPPASTSTETAKKPMMKSKPPASTSSEIAKKPIAKSNPQSRQTPAAAKSNTSIKKTGVKPANKPAYGAQGSKAKIGTTAARPIAAQRKRVTVPKKSPRSAVPASTNPQENAKTVQMTGKATSQATDNGRSVSGDSNSQVDNADVRKERKKLEMRQGKELPPRKIKRTLAAKS